MPKQLHATEVLNRARQALARAKAIDLTAIAKCAQSCHSQNRRKLLINQDKNKDGHLE